MSLLLGGVATILSAAALLLCGFAFWMRTGEKVPHLLSATLELGLAWLLGAALLVGDATPLAAIKLITWQQTGVVISLTVLVWGFRRRWGGDQMACGAYWLGLSLLIGVLALVGEPVLVAAAACLTALSSWGCARPGAPASDDARLVRYRQEGALLLLTSLVVAAGMR
jgi:hypothetical protein